MQDNREFLILSGLPASGKSTYAKEWVAVDPVTRYRSNYDDLRLELFGPEWKFNRRDEKQMQEIAKGRVISALKEGMSLVIDNTNLTQSKRDEWKALAISYGSGIPIVEREFDTPVEQCVIRDGLRTGTARVGRAVIERMALFNGFIDWEDRELYPRDFIIVDMDGTLASCEARRQKAFMGPTVHKAGCETQVFDRQCPDCSGLSKKNWGIFYQGIENDPPISPIVDLVYRLYAGTGEGVADNALDIIVVSGRPINDAGKETEDWLKKHLPVPVTHLFMRNSGDSRHDFIIKQEILDLLPKDRIRYVLDDRDQVVAMWRKNGLTCLQVNDGNF